MAQGKYSDSLQRNTSIVRSRPLVDTLSALKDYTAPHPVRQYRWDENRLAVSIELEVDLPPLGIAGGLDLRETEPILLVFDLKQYPHVAPLVYPDRTDFPGSQLPHLYVARTGKPPALCLARGGGDGLDDWYADRRIEDVLIRAQNWLRDAAAGELATDAAQFDPLRLEGYRGSFTYNYNKLWEVVRNKQSFEGGNFARILWMNNAKDNSGRVDLKFKAVLTPITIGPALGIGVDEKGNTQVDIVKKNLHPGFLVWASDATPISTYQTNLPGDWREFLQFCNELGIDPTGLEKELATERLSVKEEVPITVAIQRPRPIIGFPGSVEFINFVVTITAAEKQGETIGGAAQINFCQHRQVLEPAKAKEISGFDAAITSLSLVVGLGALGSRVALHLLKSGTTELLLCDHDKLLPHNFVRHPLSARNVDVNKAAALAFEAKALYPEIFVLPVAKKADASLLQLQKNGWEWILDFSASLCFFNLLVTTSLKHSVKVCRGLISDKGNLGLLYFEGPSRNPRIDDMQVLIYDAAMTNPAIAAWLQREAVPEQKTETVVTGIGCNAETTILSEDVVALHAAIISGLVKGQTKEKARKGGRVFLNQLNFDPYFHNQVSSLTFRPVDILSTRNRTDWQVRFAAGIMDELREKMRQAVPRETGGVLVGCANHKTKTIHVTRTIPAPSDSQADHSCFYRGTQGLPEAIAQVTDRTGGQLGYIGEWHSHPQGPNDLSRTDAATVREFLQEYRGLNPPLPVFLLIITPTSILPFVYT